MKPIAFALCALAAIGAAQTPQDDRSRERIRSAYEDIRTRGDFSLTLWGTDRGPGRTDNLRCYLYWRQPEESAPKLEILSYRNDVLTQRIVGDGTTFWSHDLLRNQYSAFSYTRSANDPMRKLLDLAGSTVRGPEAHGVRVLREIVGGLPTQWRALPVQPSEDAQGDITYQLGDPVRRWTFFDLEPLDFGGSRLTSVKFYEATPVGNRKRELNLTLMSGTLEPDHPFTFKAPPGARSVRG